VNKGTSADDRGKGQAAGGQAEAVFAKALAQRDGRVAPREPAQVGQPCFGAL
jgi:hypothetical protein